MVPRFENRSSNILLAGQPTSKPPALIRVSDAYGNTQVSFSTIGHSDFEGPLAKIRHRTVAPSTSQDRSPFLLSASIPFSVNPTPTYSSEPSSLANPIQQWEFWLWWFRELGSQSQSPVGGLGGPSQALESDMPRLISDFNGPIEERPRSVRSSILTVRSGT